MKRLAMLVLALALLSLSPASAAAADDGDASACRHPELERLYDEESFFVRLVLDLSGCEWWDGSPIQLEATLMRHDGEDGYAATSFTVCGVSPTHDGPRPRREADPCEVVVGFEHPPVERARYDGEVTYPWRGGERTLSFDATCTSGGGRAGCRDDGAGG